MKQLTGLNYDMPRRPPAGCVPASTALRAGSHPGDTAPHQWASQTSLTPVPGGPCTEPAVGLQQVRGRGRRRGGRRRRQGRLRQRQCAAVRARRRRRRQQWLHVLHQRPQQELQQQRQPQPPLSLINAELCGPEQSREHRGLWNSRGSRRQ